MNLQESHQTFGWGAIVCVIGFILNLSLIKRKGKSAKILASAFAFLGCALGLLSQGAPILYAVPLLVVVLALMIYDAALKIQKSGARS